MPRVQDRLKMCTQKEEALITEQLNRGALNRNIGKEQKTFPERPGMPTEKISFSRKCSDVEQKKPNENMELATDTTAENRAASIHVQRTHNVRGKWGKP